MENDGASCSPELNCPALIGAVHVTFAPFCAKEGLQLPVDACPPRSSTIKEFPLKPISVPRPFENTTSMLPLLPFTLMPAQFSWAVIKQDSDVRVETEPPEPWINMTRMLDDKIYATIASEDAYIIRYSIPNWTFRNPTP